MASAGGEAGFPGRPDGGRQPSSLCGREERVDRSASTQPSSGSLRPPLHQAPGSSSSSSSSPLARMASNDSSPQSMQPPSTTTHAYINTLHGLPTLNTLISRRKTAKKGQPSRSPPYTVSEDIALFNAVLNDTRKRQDLIEYKKANSAARKDAGHSTNDDSETETPQEIPRPIGRMRPKKAHFCYTVFFRVSEAQGQCSPQSMSQEAQLSASLVFSLKTDDADKKLRGRSSVQAKDDADKGLLDIKVFLQFCNKIMALENMWFFCSKGV
ncbi:hypothetical protein U9M48_034954 [Paspalum notatum var. saurae]|uniref:Uncharacterized protein n=1 Tax=Paspalum notatum var. saurae TaxID=547442 RepID=A0AAQ3UC02_PASNO